VAGRRSVNFALPFLNCENVDFLILMRDTVRSHLHVPIVLLSAVRTFLGSVIGFFSQLVTETDLVFCGHTFVQDCQ